MKVWCQVDLYLTYQLMNLLVNLEFTENCRIFTYLLFLGELPASSDLDPNFFFQDNSTPSRPVVDLDSLSGEMLGMALDGSPQPGPPLNDSNHAQRYITRQTSQLETPDVSMDTSKGRNNLDM